MGGRSDDQSPRLLQRPFASDTCEVGVLAKALAARHGRIASTHFVQKIFSNSRTHPLTSDIVCIMSAAVRRAVRRSRPSLEPVQGARHGKEEKEKQEEVGDGRCDRPSSFTRTQEFDMAKKKGKKKK
jgi:hypothetical protein